jgi:hypothetical protein
MLTKAHPRQRRWSLAYTALMPIIDYSRGLYLHATDFALNLSTSTYGSTVLVDLGRFFSFLIYTQSVGLLGRGIGPSQGRYLQNNINTE